MIATQVVRGRSRREVSLDQIPLSTPQGAVLDAALAAAGLTVHNIFDYDVTRDGPRAFVVLHTD